MSPTPTPASLDRSERAGSPGLVVLLAFCLVAVMVAFSFMPHEQATRLILVPMAILGSIGISALLAYAMGFLQLAGAHARNDVTKIIADTSPDGMIVTEGESRIIYANETYMALAVVRRAGSFRADLPPCPGGARGQARG
jgi:two-component system cell cycle sensor histidine kinase/response regulator CckA